MRRPKGLTGPWGPPAAIFLLSSAVSLWSLSRHFEGGLTHEFCQYAEIGRNIIEGRGLRTGMVYPYALAYLDERGIPFDENHLAPVLDRFPLQAALTAAAEAVGGACDASVAALSLLLSALCAAATCAAGASLFSPLEGALAGLFFALNPTFQRAFLLWGLPDFGFCLLTLLASWMLVRVAGDRKNPAEIAATGALCGLAWTARSNFVLWLPIFLWALARPGAAGKDSPSRRIGLFALAFSACSLPAAAYNLRWYGSLNPPTMIWNLAHHTVMDDWPALSYRVFSPSDIILNHFPQLARKFFHYLFLHLRDLPGWWQMRLLSPMAAAGLFFLGGERDQDARLWSRLMLAMLAAQILVFSGLRYETLGPNVGGRYFLWFAPAAFLLAARGALGVAEKLGKRLPAAAAWAAVNAAFFLWRLSSPQGAAAYPGGLKARRWPELAAAERAAGSGGLVATNLSGQVVWYTRCRAVHLPLEPRELVALGRRHRIDAVLLSRLRVAEPGDLAGWRRLLSDAAALREFGKEQGFPIVQDFGTSVLLARRK